MSNMLIFITSLTYIQSVKRKLENQDVNGILPSTAKQIRNFA